MKVPKYQQCGATNRVRQRRNRAIVRAMIEGRSIYPTRRYDPLEELEGSVEVSVISNGKAGALRQHLKAGGEWNNGHYWRRS